MSAESEKLSEVLGLVDTALRSYSHQSIVDGENVKNTLLDIRQVVTGAVGIVIAVPQAFAEAASPNIEVVVEKTI